MKMLELLEEHPKTATVVKQWLLDKMLESLKSDSVPEDFKELVKQQGIDNERVAGILQGSPRALFDVFDGHKLYVETLHETTGFWWKIKSGDEYVRLSSDSYSERKESDSEAIVEAFKLLEAKL